MKVAIRYVAVAAMCVSALVPAAAAAATPAASHVAKAAAPIEVRVNQVGYPARGSKVAFVMLPAKGQLKWSLSCVSCGAAGRGFGARYVGSWNSRYKAVYELNFSPVRQPGRYRISVIAGKARGTSPWFQIGASRQ